MRYYICSCSSTIKTSFIKWFNNKKHKNCKILRRFISNKKNCRSGEFLYSMVRINFSEYLCLECNTYGKNTFYYLFNVETNSIINKYVFEDIYNILDVESLGLKLIDSLEFL